MQFTQEHEELRRTVRNFVEKELNPHVKEWEEAGRFPIHEVFKKMGDLGLLGVTKPEEFGGMGLDYSYGMVMAEEMGRTHCGGVPLSTGVQTDMATPALARFGSDELRQNYLAPAIAGDMVASIAVSEPHAGSDVAAIKTTATKDGDDYVINGRKFYISGAMRKTCEIMIVMGKTDPDNPNRHAQQSQILVPTNTPGVNIVRPMQVFGYNDAPEGHAEVVFDNVRVPKENMILGEGRGFEIAQGRLGPGRIHHCMRLIGAAQEAFELMAKRVNERVVFGQPMSKQGSVREDLAKSWCEIEQARLMTLKAADTMDREGNKVAKDLIAMIKVVAPNMALNVIDRAIQVHGAAGLSQDTPLVNFFSYARTLRLADGPDQVHMMQLGRNLAKYFA